MKLTESTLIGTIITECKGMAMVVDFLSVTEAIQSCITGTVDFLCKTKSKKEKTALAFEDLKGNMIIAATVEYIEGEDGNPGNWALEFTFDPEDIKEGKTYSIYESAPKDVISKRSFDDFRLIYASNDALAKFDVLFFSLLKDYLDQNAKEGEKVTLEHEGYFVASVEVVDGEKVMSFIPDGAVKRLIKDDDSSSEEASK